MKIRLRKSASKNTLPSAEKGALKPVASKPSVHTGSAHPTTTANKSLANKSEEVLAASETEDADDVVERSRATNASSSQLKKLWGPELIEAGWVAIPSTFLEKQHALGLTPTEFNVLVQIARFWWTADNLPHPSKATIAKAMNMNPRSVQRVISRLEDLKLLKRHERRTGPKGSMSTRYDFTGLISIATPFAKEALAERERLKAEKQARLKRMRPKRVLDGEEGGSANRA